MSTNVASIEGADISPLYPSRTDVPEFEELLRTLAAHHGSDIFVTVGAPIKLKINGVQRQFSNRIIRSDDVAEILVGGVSGGSIETLDKKKELNCAVSLPGVGRFRLSAFFQRGQKAIVVRYIPPSVPAFDTLGLPAVMKDLVMLKRGLILTVGPTGSGKSTTLASLIDHRNALRADHIFTIEDPIEFLFEHKRSIVNQRELGTDAFSYEEALKNAMRQAPDVILIGEIRDQQTMSMAMQYAQSGHLCLATLHANNSYHALNRIVGFYEPGQRSALFSDLASSLQAVISQRLVPTKDGLRRAAVEVLIKSKLIEDLIEKGNISGIPEAMDKSLASGTQTFEEVLCRMVEDKLISADTAMLYSDSPTNLFWKLSTKGIPIDSRAAREAGVDRDELAKTQTTRAPSDSDAFGGLSISAERVSGI
jgi:twitching motility protein PilU